MVYLEMAEGLPPPLKEGDYRALSRHADERSLYLDCSSIYLHLQLTQVYKFQAF